jgi:hypothetical protein
MIQTDIRNGEAMNGRWAFGVLVTAVTCAASAGEPKDPAFRDEIVARMRPSVEAEKKADRRARDARAMIRANERPEEAERQIRQGREDRRSRFEAALKTDAEWLKKKVAVSGWPSVTAVGDEAAALAFRLALAGDLASRKEWLALAEKLPAGECPPLGLVQLADRVAADEGRPSLYGMVLTGPAHKPVPFGGGDVAGIDKRRKALGIRPWGEHLAYAPGDFVWRPNPERKP